METMKIVEALKRLRVIEKRMATNSLSIQKYASMLSNEKPSFVSEDEQRKEVKSLIQANTDLMTEYLNLKKKIEETNLKITVAIDGKDYCLSDLLVIKRKLADTMMSTYKALNDTEATSRLVRGVRTIEGQPNTHVVKMYDEKEKNANLDFWQNMRDNIDSRVEVVNATTDLV